MDSRYIGVFDSGLGGLTCVKQLSKELPYENIIYFGDTARVPYGSRSRETIIKYTQEAVNFLLQKDVKMIILACGTASSVAINHLICPTPIIGVVEPAAKAAAKATKTGKIGVLGTSATISMKRYEKELYDINPDFEIVANACPLFVPLVENGHTDSEVAHLVAKEYLTPLKKAGVDTIILGCTHYPLLSGVISDIMEGATLIDTGAEAAKHAKELLMGNNISKIQADYKFYVSDTPESFARLGSLFLEKDIDCLVEKVDFE